MCTVINVFISSQCIRDVGEVNMILDNGDVQVRYKSNALFTFNPLVLVKVLTFTYVYPLTNPQQFSHIHVYMY